MKKTIDDKYSLLNIADLLDRLGRCQYFTTLDLASEFHQIDMEDNDIPKAAFNAENEHYDYLKMLACLKNASAIQNKKCLSYLDDIIIFSTSLQEYIDKLRLVFQKLRDSNFKIQLDKSEFLRKEVACSGHILKGVKLDPNKIKAIKNYLLTSTTNQIKSFLVLLSY